MKTKSNSIVSIILGLSLCLFSLSACTTTGRTGMRPAPSPSPTPQGQNIIQTNPRAGAGGITSPLPNATVSPSPNRTPLTTQPMAVEHAKAQNIKNQLQGVKEISHADVIVIGNTALIGYTPSKTSKDTNTTKNMVINKVKQADGSITNVACSESGDVVSKIGQLSSDIANNRPANEISSRFNDLVRGLVPSIR